MDGVVIFLFGCICLIIFLSMGRLLEEFDAQICTSNDIDGAVYAIVEYANQTGMALQHTDFNDFMGAMQSEDAFVLK